MRSTVIQKNAEGPFPDTLITLVVHIKADLPKFKDPTGDKKEGEKTVVKKSKISVKRRMMQGYR